MGNWEEEGRVGRKKSRVLRERRGRICLPKPGTLGVCQIRNPAEFQSDPKLGEVPLEINTKSNLGTTSIQAACRGNSDLSACTYQVPLTKSSTPVPTRSYKGETALYLTVLIR